MVNELMLDVRVFIVIKYYFFYFVYIMFLLSSVDVQKVMNFKKKNLWGGGLLNILLYFYWSM